MDPLQLFHNLINLAAADQKFTQEEISYLVKHANRYNIPNEEFETALHGIMEGTLEVTLPESLEDRIHLMKEMIKMMAIDGNMDDTEKRLCAQASAKMDFTSGQFAEILEQVIKGE
jgi:uncharacterized tellurite resistance protein B-like protein